MGPANKVGVRHEYLGATMLFLPTVWNLLVGVSLVVGETERITVDGNETKECKEACK